MSTPPAEPTAFEEARARYEEQRKALQEELGRGFSGIPRLYFFTTGFGSAAVEYVMAGLRGISCGCGEGPRFSGRKPQVSREGPPGRP